MSLGFVVCFGIVVIRWLTVKGPRVAFFIWVLDLGHFMCIARKINNMQLCVKIMLICAYVMY